MVANVTYMFDHGATAAAPQEKGHLALHNYAFRAWTKGDASIDLFNLLVSRGASVDAISQCQDPPTGTPLQLASLLYELPQNAAHRERLVEVAMYLIGRGASTDLSRLSHHFMQRAQSLAANYTSRQDEAADGSVGGSAESGSAVTSWDVAQLSRWLDEELHLSNIASKATENRVDGATALELTREDWQSLLGASQLDSARIVGKLKRK